MTARSGATLASCKETTVRNYFMLESEASHRHFEHERQVKSAAVAALAARTSEPGPRSRRQMFTFARSVTLTRLLNPIAPSLRLSLGADRARS